MTATKKNVYIDELQEIAKGCNNTFHFTVKKKAIDVKSDTVMKAIPKFNKKKAKFKIWCLARSSEKHLLKRMHTKLLQRSVWN